MNGALFKRVSFSMELKFGPFRGLASRWEKFLELADQPFGLIFDLPSGDARRRENGWNLMEMDGNPREIDGNELKMTGKKKKKRWLVGGRGATHHPSRKMIEMCEDGKWIGMEMWA